MANQLNLEVVTPTQMLISTKADSVILPGTVGELGILPSHIPLLTTLKAGSVVYHLNGQPHTVALSSGYAQVENDRITVLAKIEEVTN